MIHCYVNTRWHDDKNFWSFGNVPYIPGIFSIWSRIKSTVYILNSTIRASENLWQTARTKTVAIHCHYQEKGRVYCNQSLSLKVSLSVSAEVTSLLQHLLTMKRQFGIWIWNTPVFLKDNSSVEGSALLYQLPKYIWGQLSVSFDSSCKAFSLHL